MKIFYNGSTGSLGQYFGASLTKLGIEGRTLHSRLENSGALALELGSTPAVVPGEFLFLVHMAALVSVKVCEETPSKAFQTNVTHTIETVGTFVRWARQLNTIPVVVYVSTGHVYKAPSERKPVTEDDPVAPRSVYARTKLEAEKRLQELAEQLGFLLLIGRVFGLVAPRQPSHYVLPGLIQRVRNKALAGIPGLDYFRDYLDSRDVCDTLALLCATVATLRAVPFCVLNICSGKGVSIRHMVEEIIRAMQPHGHQEMLSSMSAGPGRPDDVPWLVGSSERFKTLTGKNPHTIGLAETIRDTLREGVQKSPQN